VERESVTDEVPHVYVMKSLINVCTQNETLQCVVLLIANNFYLFQSPEILCVNTLYCHVYE
jgi:hypothetical protein